MNKIKICIENKNFYGVLKDTPTANKIIKSLPIESVLNTWGDEIYFRIPVKCDLEKNSKTEVEIGDLAYWPDMPAFCIFFGLTPVSHGEKPVAAGPVNVFGEIENIDIQELRQIQTGQSITVELI